MSPKRPAPLSAENRTVDLSSIEVRSANGKLTLRGHAAVFDKPSVPMFDFREYIRKGAFTESLAQDDIRSLWNHNSDLVLGRNKAGTLRLSEDKDGLQVEIDLPDTQAGRDAKVSVERGDVTQMSFGFRTKVGGDRWFEESGEARRELLNVQLFEVSPVAFPAYPDTDVSLKGLRSFGIDPELLGKALARAEADQELRADDIVALETALGILNRFHNPSLAMRSVTDSLEEAKEWLKKAIERHERHMNGTEATDEESQKKMMDEMKKAYSLLGGVMEMKSAARFHRLHTPAPSAPSHKIALLRRQLALEESH